MKLLLISYYKLKLLLKDRMLLAAMVIIPLIIAAASGSALRHEKQNTIPLTISDEDSTDYSKTLISRLLKKEGLKIEITSRENSLKLLENNKAEAAIIIAKGFEEKIRSGTHTGIIEMAKAPSSISTEFIKEVVADEVVRFTSAQTAADWVFAQYKKMGLPVRPDFKEEVIKDVDSHWQPKPLMTVDYKEIGSDNVIEVDKAKVPAASASSAGLLVIFIMFYLLFCSGWLVEEKRNGTLKRLTAGSNALGIYFAGNILALMTAGIAQVILLSAIENCISGVTIFPGIWAYLLLFIYILCVISIGLFLSAILKTPSQLQAVAPLFALFTGFAGGCFFNTVEISEGMRKISLATPEGWVLEGINKLFAGPQDLSSIAVPALILLIISLILLPISYIIIRVNATK